MQHLRSALVAFLLCVAASSAMVAQDVAGSSSVDVDPDSGVVTATCETDVDAEVEAYYNAQVSCSLKSQTGTVVASGQSGDLGGYAEVTLILSGVPGNTYTVTGQHSAQMLLQYVDPNEPVPEPPRYPSYSWDDWFQLGIFNGQDDFLNGYTWFGPGPETSRQTNTVHTGNTHSTAIRYYTLNELQSLINQAQSLFPAQCNAAFAAVIGPSYHNADFFNSLRVTTIYQYPLGAPNTPAHELGADADTEYLLPGRPINLFANFYPNEHGLQAGFQQFVLIHEGLHHYTGWLDFPDSQNPTTPNFISKFGTSGYRYMGGGTGDFTIWLQAGCPKGN